jgi:hypothetical protein
MIAFFISWLKFTMTSSHITKWKGIKMTITDKFPRCGLSDTIKDINW